MNLTRIISIKERIATSPLFTVEERAFILDAINMAVAVETMRLSGLRGKIVIEKKPG